MTDTAALIAARPASVAHLFLARIRDSADAEAYRFPRPSAGGGEHWESLTWGQTGQRVMAIAAGLISLGVRPEDRVAIAAGTRVEWILADLGILCAGAATTTVYPSTDADETAYILADSGSRVLFAEDAAQLAKVAGQRERLPELTAVITFEEVGQDGVLSLAELEAAGARLLAHDPAAVLRTIEGIEREHLATLIYTSGTTGRPKGVRLVHDCWTYQSVATVALDGARADDLEYLWLPMAHAFGKSQLNNQITAGYAMAVDGRLERFADNLRLIRPTVTAAVPRVFEKVYIALAADARAKGRTYDAVFRWAARVAREYTRVAQERGAARGGGMETGKPLVPLGLKLRHALADLLVYRGVRAAFGGRLRGCLSGSAPLSPEIAGFFGGAGVNILEGYGLTETCAGATIAVYEYRTGLVGKPLPGLEVRISDLGEILLRGPGLMRYHHLPEQTAQVLDADGWFHTGDSGELTPDGYLRITGRIKELIKTSGGKYVAPIEIESRFKAVCPYVADIIVVGDGRQYCSALITLDEPAILAWAAAHGLPGRPYADVCVSSEVHALIGGYVAEVNATLQRWQTVKRFTVLPRQLSLAEGELTPSMKVRRAAVERNHAPTIAAMYD
ncbi:long-chain fatty acid--CoA ligase [Catellatospora sp. NPDC049609]|uniref:AMP-dependent synthetase/ligase n=1 Tax=Catellatospora sp. NPDC049609 TaxID=3155505 RepID=UPI00343875F1